MGKEFAPQSLQTSRDKHRMLRISAFHPGFAVNRVPFEGCFRRLLHLEFSQGLGSLVGDWKEEEWMATLRWLCREKAEMYNGMSPFSNLAYFQTTDYSRFG